MANKKLQIFVSSTYSDMLAERQAIVEAILMAGHIPAGMELFAAGDKSQLETEQRGTETSIPDFRRRNRHQRTKCLNVTNSSGRGEKRAALRLGRWSALPHQAPLAWWKNSGIEVSVPSLPKSPSQVCSSKSALPSLLKFPQVCLV